ncbi:hypothetical protein [Leuconostoc pseudomesenteroides]|uniref:hypothetical protein n=1 Tax=Leuconostoc pseudomesenteroides TaxID=33968 RepID=UPI0039EC52BF
MMEHLLLVITNEDLMKQILKMEKIRTFDATIIPPLIVAVSSLIATWISNYYAGKNMERQIEEQRRLSKVEYNNNEKLQRHIFIDELRLKKLTELSTELPNYFRQNFAVYVHAVMRYYDAVYKNGISGEHTLKIRKDSIQIIDELNGMLNTHSPKIKRLVAYSNDSIREQFESLDVKISKYVINEINMYLDDMKKGDNGVKDAYRVAKKMRDDELHYAEIYLEFSDSIDKEITSLIDNLIE